MPKQAGAASRHQDQSGRLGREVFLDVVEGLPPIGRTWPNPAEDPGGAFRALFDAWVRQGGYERGKPRRSAQQIKAWLGAADRVRSLETKLAGKTRVPRDEASRLINLFLKYWQFNDADGSHKSFGAKDLQKLSAQLLLEFYPPGSSAAESGLLLPRRRRGSGSASKTTASAVNSMPLDEIHLSAKVIPDLFGLSDALFTISRERTIIGANPALAMLGFQNLIDLLWQANRNLAKPRALIWIVDIGQRQHDEAAQLALQNMEFLATQFRAFAMTVHADRDQRWQWLRDQTAIIIGGLRQQEIDSLYEAAFVVLSDQLEELPWLAPHRLFFESLPDHWHDQPVYRALLGPSSDLHRRRTITVHAKLDGWPGEAGKDPTSERDEDPNTDLRYWVHVPPDPEAANRNVSEGARCVELPRPTPHWGDAVRIALTASFYRLGQSVENLEFGGPQALAQLRRHNFAVVTAPEFLQLSNRLIGVG